MSSNPTTKHRNIRERSRRAGVGAQAHKTHKEQRNGVASMCHDVYFNMYGHEGVFNSIEFNNGVLQSQPHDMLMDDCPRRFQCPLFVDGVSD